MATRETSVMDELRDLTECSICNSMISDPRGLPCIHTFCLECLENFESSSSGKPGDKMLCPVCRKEFTIPPEGMNGFQKNFFVERLTELMKISKPIGNMCRCDACKVITDERETEVEATEYCIQCREKLCGLCSMEHLRNKLSRNHQVVKIGCDVTEILAEKQYSSVCDLHPDEKTKMYCVECRVVICMMCFVESHNSHKCMDVRKAGEKFQENIENDIRKLANFPRETLDLKKQLVQEKRTFMNELQVSERMIKLKCKELKDMVDSHANSLLDELNSVEQRRFKLMDTRKEEVERYLESVDRFTTYSKEIISRGSFSDICRAVHNLYMRADELQKLHEIHVRQKIPSASVTFNEMELQCFLHGNNIVGKLEEKDKRDEEVMVAKESLLPLMKRQTGLSLKLTTAKKLSRSDSVMDITRQFGEFLRNLLLIKKGHAVLLSGSSFELPLQYVITNATDVDMMYIPTDMCALPDNAFAPQDFQGKRFTIHTEDTHPGFARLYSPDCKQHYWRQANIAGDHYRHGPAWTKTLLKLKFISLIAFICKFLRISEYKETKRRLEEMKLDRVFAMHCPYWPTEADEWITRERPSGWPPLEIINKVIAGGCHFVAKPHHSTPDDDTQWRFSFSQAEVILIHSWTDVQKYIYHILRLIKSEVVKACGGPEETSICTYFFKTLMFWECERKSKEFWKDENVEKAISELLCIMIGRLIEGYCPNYFIPNSNMISALTESVDFTKEIQQLLIYATSSLTIIINAWPRICSKHVTGLVQVVVPNQFLEHMYLVQVCENVLNPLFPKINTQLLKKLTEKNSMFLRAANDLCRGILSHLQLMKTWFPQRNCLLKQEALHHFMQSQMERGDDCSKVSLPIDGSICEVLERINSITDCKYKSNRTQGEIRNDSLELNLSGNWLQSALKKFPADCDNNAHRRIVRGCLKIIGICLQSALKKLHVVCGNKTGRRFVRCYYREQDSEEDDRENKATINAANDNLNTPDRRKLLNLCAVLVCYAVMVDYSNLTTHAISSAYLANFYYTALHDYRKTSAVCDTVLNFPVGSLKGGKSEHERMFPLFITTELCPIFDEHFQSVLGLIALFRSVVSSKPIKSTVLVRMCPAQFLRYLKIQCRKWDEVDTPAINENFECRHSFYEVNNTYERLSAVFMSAVLHASRCQF